VAVPWLNVRKLWSGSHCSGRAKWWLSNDSCLCRYCFSLKGEVRLIKDHSHFLPKLIECELAFGE
jgi:hypothetical protein